VALSAAETCTGLRNDFLLASRARGGGESQRLQELLSVDSPGHAHEKSIGADHRPVPTDPAGVAAERRPLGLSCTRPTAWSAATNGGDPVTRWSAPR